jgi:hypothetical protein
MSVRILQIGIIRGRQWGREGGALLRLRCKRVGQKPKWLERILERDFGGQIPPDWRWADHWGSVEEQFICEPYGLCSADMQSVQRFCERYGLDYHISALSQHYPTWTVSLSIWPKEPCNTTGNSPVTNPGTGAKERSICRAKIIQAQLKPLISEKGVWDGFSAVFPDGCKSELNEEMSRQMRMMIKEGHWRDLAGPESPIPKRSAASHTSQEGAQ